MLGQLKQLFETTGDEMAVKFSGIFKKRAPVCFSSVETPGKMHATPMCQTIAFSRFVFPYYNVIQRWMRGNVGLKVQNSSKLSYIRARLHCNMNEQS